MDEILRAKEELEKKFPILIVDDNELNREILSIIFSEYSVVVASNGTEALDLIRNPDNRYSAMLVDYLMPEMDGIKLLEIIKREKLLNNIPIFLITSEEEDSLASRAYELGVVDFIQRPISAFIVLKRVEAFIELFKTRDALKRLLEIENAKVERFSSGLKLLMDALFSPKRAETESYASRIKAVSRLLLTQTELGKELKEDDIKDIMNAISLRRLGVLAQDPALERPLLHPTMEEQEVLLGRNNRAVEFLNYINNSEDSKLVGYTRDIALYQYEQWDGKGLPSGLKQDQIPLWAQAVTFAMKLDDIMENSETGSGTAFEETMKRIESGEFGEFNPKVINAVKALSDEIKGLYPIIK